MAHFQIEYRQNRLKFKIFNLNGYRKQTGCHNLKAGIIF